MKTLLMIRHAFQRQRRRTVWSIASAFVLPVALLVVLTTCSSPTACAMGRVAGQANVVNSQRANVPAGLPTHFSFGLMSAPGTSGGMNDMRTRNGTEWDARYQYLAAGVNTGNGWQTWEQPGQFATLYMQESQRERLSAAFVYYMLLQSNGPDGDGGEKGKDLAHLAIQGDEGVLRRLDAADARHRRVWQACAGDRRAGPVGLHRAGGGGHQDDAAGHAGERRVVRERRPGGISRQRGRDSRARCCICATSMRPTRS